MTEHHRVTVLGNFSGRNAGDNAILGNLLQDISSKYTNVKFIVPTLNTRFIRETFRQYNINALGMMPWNGALKIFGLPTLRAMLATDLVLITDNILFDRAFFNPAFNYLSTISLIAPICKRRKIPIVLYNASVGPIQTKRGQRALQRVLDASPIGILRDANSKDHMLDLHLRCPRFISGADCALNTKIPNSSWIASTMQRLFTNEKIGPMIGLNINSYFGSWQESANSRSQEEFLDIVADSVNRLAADVDARVILFVTQVMDNRITRQLQSRLNSDDVPVIANPEYNYDEITGLLSQVDLLIGMRTHAQILAVSVATPVVNINSYPKTRAFLETVGVGDWSIDVGDLDPGRFFDLISRAWLNKESIRGVLEVNVARERDKARLAADHIAQFLR